MFTRIGDTTRKYLEQFRGGRFCPAAPIVFVEMTVEHTRHVLGATAFAAPIVHYDVPASHRVGGRRCSASLSLSSRRLLAGATFFNPHVTIGVATEVYLKEMLAAPFEPFTFSPAGASVYQLGDFGTARKELKALELMP